MEINNFIRTIMEDDLSNNRVNEIITRFPPEPNSYLHLGHARAIVTSFELAKLFGGKTNLRFDDTNPLKEDNRFIQAIIDDLIWLGYKPDNIFYGSDYFDKTFEVAVRLIKKGLAYVCDLSQEEVSKTRGDLTTPGQNSPYRNRSVEENLKLFYEMKDGKYPNGSKTLRAKIDMAHPNINMRDPAMYRIIHSPHHRQGDKWCIYPMYDFAHPLQDAFEGITHSLCSLEFDNHRILYDWFIENGELEHTPHQYEFGRLNISNTIMSKRYLKQLVENKIVKDYDDPRMPTLVGIKRRGFTPESIKNFVLQTGLSRQNITVPFECLEESLRDDLKTKVYRYHAIVDPLKVTITNYNYDIEYLDCVNNSENEALGSRKIAFSKSIYIEREDFMEIKPDKSWKRLSLGNEVRLMHGYFIKCNEVIKDESGNIVELLCSYDIKTKSNTGFKDRKPDGTIHFVEASTAKKAKFRLYEPLLLDNNVENFLESINQNSFIEKEGFIDGSFSDTHELDKFQFVRNGYYTQDKDSNNEYLVFNRICSLKSSYKKKEESC